LQQTELSFLSPPAQRSKCRYFNVEKLVNWARKILASSWDVLKELVGQMDEDVLKKKILEKLGWLFYYYEDLKHWSLMIEITRTLEKQLKCSGINQESLKKFEMTRENLTDPLLNNFKQQVINYLVGEMSKVSLPDPLLATSDVVESLFGKYKIFSARSPLKQISQLLLTIVLSTINLTPSFIKEALETIRFIDVESWREPVFGSSALAKRNALFSFFGMETA
jgi:hypothetical protein